MSEKSIQAYNMMFPQANSLFCLLPYETRHKRTLTHPFRRHTHIRSYIYATYASTLIPRARVQMSLSHYRLKSGITVCAYGGLTRLPRGFGLGDASLISYSSLPLIPPPHSVQTYKIMQYCLWPELHYNTTMYIGWTPSARVEKTSFSNLSAEQGRPVLLCDL